MAINPPSVQTIKKILTALLFFSAFFSLFIFNIKQIAKLSPEAFPLPKSGGTGENVKISAKMSSFVIGGENAGLVTLKFVLKDNSFTSIITTGVDGRIGNQLSAYASLLYFQKVHGMQAVLVDWQINMLAQVFQKDRLEIPTIEIELPSALQIKWEHVFKQTPKGAFFPNEDFLTNIDEYKQNQFLHIGGYPNYLFLYKEILPYLREHLLFKGEIQGLVTQLIMQIRSEDTSGKTIVFVGVHCRRTDFAEHLKKYGDSNTSLVDHHFFDKAFQMYRSKYNTPSSHVIFLSVSDDVAWIKENLSRHKDVYFGDNFSQGKVTEGDLPGFDLSLLAACNHSIHTYGTFGQWGSLLAGGEVIAVMGTNEKANSEGDQINQRAAMEGWSFLDVRNKTNIEEVVIVCSWC